MSDRRDAFGDAASDESVEDVESDEVDSFLVGLARIDPESPPPVLPRGVKIGPYEILALIGRGGMGVVYRVVDTRLGRENALKLLRRNVTDARRDRGLRREARSLAAAHHPNVATVFEVGEADGHVYLAMELVQGTTLRARIAAGRLAVEEAVRIAREIAIAVAHAHSKGIIHRDLKPENVMLTPDGAVKVLDFGIARASALRGETRGDGDVDTLEGTVMGTPGYMAPEQARGEATDARTDVYALGIVIHEMLTGARPGVLEGMTGVADGHLAAIILRCVASSPEQRWSDAGSVVEALDARSVAMRPRPATRRFVAGLGIIALAAVVLWFGARARGARRGVVASTSAVGAATGSGDVGGSRPEIFFGAVAPVTTSPDALKEYRRGMTDLRDGIRNPQSALLRATKLDPDFAAALLRRSFNSWQPASAHFFNEAVRTRDRLDARDLDLLSAEEPLELTTPPDLVEGERRFRALLEKRPGDAEVALRLGWIAYWQHDRAGMMESHDLISAIDPTMAAAEASVGYFARESHDLDLAELHYQTCSDKWPGAVACLTGLGRTRGERGACGDYFSLMRRAVTLTPDDWFVRLRFLEAMLAAGGTEIEARAEVQIEKELFDDLSKHLAVHADLERALWFGSFADADAALERSQTIMRETTGWSGITFVSARLAVAEERGDDAAVVALARRYVGHRAGRPPAIADGFILSALVRHDVMPPAEIARLRDVWRGEAEASVDWQPWQAVLYFESALATTSRDADAVLSHVDLTRLPAVLAPAEGLILGRLLLLAGRPVEARDALRNAAGVCSFMDSGGSETQSAALVRASYELGRACEETGDAAAACAAYQRVLDRWGHAAPRSLTAEGARAARSRLHCEGAGSGG